MPQQQYPPYDPQGQNYQQYPEGNYQQYPNQGNYPQEGYGDVTEQNINQGGASVQRKRQSYQDPSGKRVEQRKEVYRDFNQSMINARYWITSIIYFLLGVLEVVLDYALSSAYWVQVKPAVLSPSCMISVIHL